MIWFSMESHSQKNPKNLLHKNNKKTRNHRTKIRRTNESRNRNYVFIKSPTLFALEKPFRRRREFLFNNAVSNKRSIIQNITKGAKIRRKNDGADFT